jgi:predicted metal-dependent hydrolase
VLGERAAQLHLVEDAGLDEKLSDTVARCPESRSMPRGFDTCLAEGVALFNAGHFYEAHEVWEEAWLREQGARRLLLQGLILVAAGWLKRDAGKAHGAWTLFSRALERFESLPPACEGVDVGRLRPQVARWREGEALTRPVLVWLVAHQEGEP